MSSRWEGEREGFESVCKGGRLSGWIMDSKQGEEGNGCLMGLLDREKYLVT